MGTESADRGAQRGRDRTQKFGDDDKLERLAAEKGVALLVKPIANKRGAGEGRHVITAEA